MVELSEVLPFDKVSAEIDNMKEIADQITSSFAPKGDISQAGKYLSQGEKKISSLEIDYVDFLQTDSKDFIKIAYDLVLQAEVQKQEEQKQKLKKEVPKEETEKSNLPPAEKEKAPEGTVQETPPPAPETANEEKTVTAQPPVEDKKDSTPKEPIEVDNKSKKIKPHGKPARYLEMAKQEHTTALKFQKMKQFFYAISYYKRSILYSLLAITSSNSSIPDKYQKFHDKWLKKEIEEVSSPAGEKSKAEGEKSSTPPPADSGSGTEVPVENINQNQENQGEPQ